MEWETDFPGFGRVFPHPYGPADGKYYTTLLTLSPAGDELTAGFATALIDNEKIGADETTDYLSVSFSSTDYVGHLFGPSSLEAEDNLRRLDRTLADLLAHVDRKVGLDKTLIALSADHGAAEVPGYLESLGIPAGYFSFDDIDKTEAADTLTRSFGAARDLIETFSQPYVYLNEAYLDENDLDKEVVARAIAVELQKMPGIAQAISSADLRAGAVARTDISQAILANFHPERSGGRLCRVRTGTGSSAIFDGLHVASHHGSPWSYDTYVPMIIAGPGIEPARVGRRVETVDLAPTLAAYLGIKPPSGARAGC